MAQQTLSACLPCCIHGANSFSKGSLTQAMLRKPETQACRTQPLGKYTHKVLQKGPPLFEHLQDFVGNLHVWTTTRKWKLAGTQKKIWQIIFWVVMFSVGKESALSSWGGGGGESDQRLWTAGNSQSRGERHLHCKTLATSSINWPLQRYKQSLNTTEHLLRQCFCGPLVFKSPPELGSTDLSHLLLGSRACSPRQHSTEDTSLNST